MTPEIVDADAVNASSIIDGRFQLQNKIGSGSYSTVYSATLTHGGATEAFAVKLHTDDLLLNREVKIYNYMWKYKNKGFGEHLRLPKLMWDGHHDKKRAVVMSRLGLSLDKLFDSSNQKWSSCTVAKVAAQCLQLLQEVHKLGIVHRDIKPDNFAMGSGDAASHVHIFDFGLSSHYISASGKHLPMRTGLSLIGTMRYASTHTHCGHLQSRRDDLESLFYMLLYFSRGELPWRHITENMYPVRAQRNAHILRAKQALCTEQLPPFLQDFFDAIKHMKYEDAFSYNEWVTVFTHHAKTTPDTDWVVERMKGLPRQKKTLRARHPPKQKPQQQQQHCTVLKTTS